MPAAPVTANERLASNLLGRPVQHWIAEQRAKPLSWRAIANLLEDETGGQVFVTHETLRAWADKVGA